VSRYRIFVRKHYDEITTAANTLTVPYNNSF